MSKDKDNVDLVAEIKNDLDARDAATGQRLEAMDQTIREHAQQIAGAKQPETPGVPHELWGTQAKADVMHDFLTVQAFAQSQWAKEGIVKEAETRLEAVTDYGADAEGLTWMQWEYANVVTDLQNRFGLLRMTIPPWKENVVGQRGVDFPTKTGSYTANFLDEAPASRANAALNARTLGATTVLLKAIAAYAYSTHLVASTGRINFIDSIVTDHARAIARREDLTAFTATGAGGATVDGGMTGLIPALIAAGNRTTIAEAATLDFDDLFDARAELSNVVREEVNDLVYVMSYPTYSYFRKLKDNQGRYLFKTLQNDDKPFRNVDGIEILTGEVMPSASGVTVGQILLVHKSECYKWVTGTKQMVVESFSRAPQFAVGVGSYEEYAGTVVGADAGHLITFDEDNIAEAT